MNATLKKTTDKPAHSKEVQEVRRKCGNGVRMLPIVRYEQKLWFLDERLRQLRNVRNPHDFINPNDFEIEHFIKEVV